MIIKLNKDEMVHLKDKSNYNRNYYKCGNTGAEILEVCNEDYGDYKYFIIEGHRETFLGCGEEEGEINLLYDFR